MASSSTEICNLALLHLATGHAIANLETEKSAEASACRVVYETARKETLRDFPWPFATAFITLGLVQTNPTSEWGYSYRYPSDCLAFRRILSGNRNDTRQSRAPYIIGRDSQGRLIYSDLNAAQAEYTVDVIDPNQFTIDFTMALSFRIAFYIAPRLTAGDPFHMGDRAMKLYELELGRARANAMNEQQDEEEPDSEFIRAR